MGLGMKEQIWGCMSKLGVTPPSSAIRCGYYILVCIVLKKQQKSYKTVILYTI